MNLLLGLVHATPDKLENAALFFRLRLPSTLIRHENGASNRRNLKTLTSMEFQCGRKAICKQRFSKMMTSRWYHCTRFPRTETQNYRWLLRSQISHLVGFNSENIVFKFPQRSVYRALLFNVTYRFPIASIPFRTARVNHVTASQEVPRGYRYFSWLWSLVDFGNVGSGGREDSFWTNALRTNKGVRLERKEI